MRHAAEAAGQRRSLDSYRATVQDAYVVVGLRLASCLIQIAFVFVAAGSPAAGQRRFAIWDSIHYAQIIRHGYPSRIEQGDSGQLISGSEFAFSPLYPLVCAPFVHLLRMDVYVTQVIVSVICSCALAWFVFLFTVRRSGSRRAGFVAVALITCLPMSVVFQMGYAESLFGLLLVASLYAALTGRWNVAIALAVLCGLTRPLGFLPALAFPFIALAERRWPDEGRPTAPTVGRSLVYAGVGMLGVPLVWLFVAVRSGRPDGWFEVQRLGWGTGFDRGYSTFDFVRMVVRDLSGSWGLPLGVLVILLVTVVLTFAVLDRSNYPYLLVQVAAVLVVLLSSNYWHSKPRLLLAAGPLLAIAVAVKLARVRMRYVVPLVGLLALTSFLFGAYMVTDWPYAI